MSTQTNINQKNNDARQTTIACKPKSDYEIYQCLFKPYFMPTTVANRIRTVISFTSVIGARLCKLCQPFFLKWSLDSMTSKDANSAFLWIGVLFGSKVVETICTEMRYYIYNDVKHSARVELKKMTMDHIQKLSYDWHLKKKTGTVNRALDAVDCTEHIVNVLVIELGGWLLEVCISLYMLTAILHSGPVAIALTTGILVYFYTVSCWKKLIMKPLLKSRSKPFRERDQAKNDCLVNYESVKFTASEEYEHKQYTEAYDAASKAEQACYSKFHEGMVLKHSVMLLTVGVCITLSALEVLEGTISATEFVTIQVILFEINRHITWVGHITNFMVDMFTNMDILINLLKEDDFIPEPKNNTILNSQTAGCTGYVEFKGVSFKYHTRNEDIDNRLNPDKDEEEREEQVYHEGDKLPTEERMTLDDISFRVEEGQSCAFVGSTGSGKSTIVRLLYRFYDVTEGEIVINGNNIRDVTTESLRSNLGIVPQDTTLFNESLVYNLTYGSYYIKTEAELKANPEAYERVTAACKQSLMDELLVKQNEGFNTQVGERGLRLSGGEKQRLSIARCLIRNPKIFVLDEATSALDSVTEREVQYALDQLKDRTTFVVAHRLSTIQRCDKIVVLEKGKIVEIGNHTELISLQGRYFELWNVQDSEISDSCSNSSSNIQSSGSF